MPASYIDTHYSRTLATDERFPALSGRLSADACVVGGGLAGITAALELARRGRQVVLLEGRRVAWGASGRNGGFVSPGYATGLGAIEKLAGRDAAASLYRLSIEGVRIVADNIRDLGIAEAGPVPGIIAAIRYDGAAGLQAYRDRMERDFGRPLRFMPRKEVRSLLLSAKYHQALYDADSFHFHPLNYARALVRELRRLGGQVHEDSLVTGAALDGPRKVVTTAGGQVECGDVVFAGGGYTDAVCPALRRAFLPIATYILLTDPIRDRVGDAIRTNAAIGDDRRAGDYYRVVGGERILWGGRITTRTSDPHDLAERLRREMVTTYPQLADVHVEIAWSGLMSYARHLMPQIGRLQPGVWYCTAFGGHGMNTTAIGGKVVAEAIAGDGDRYRLFEPFGLAWNGGPLGRAAAQLTYWTYQAMDAWRERKAA
ncbi:FAD-binding oxidoreductase [Mycobacterium sp. KBS0706]|uniref:NAD(P)/FAD-dependent oxidoreductase n=1 Tax=Mycobacterium sp. KBS0706 TaxID=2578109 RepID=UPI00110F8292|nr:FAD-binding oxidoreductase [Mycobacterium sp. KBS0706]TSD89916.1 FAD-binding oxidoreductase [Mycobacterium sp. KBS0706]